MFKGDVALTLQILTVILAIERTAVYAIKAWRTKGSK